jgi:hypothetical protein
MSDLSPVRAHDFASLNIGSGMSDSDAALLAAFEDGTYPFAEWTHRAHVRVAWVYLRRWGLDGALDRMRAGLISYNARHGVPDELERGYHETITRAFLTLIHATMAADPACVSSEEFCARRPELLDRKALLRYYSRERIVSWEAKRRFVEPDLAPLPECPEARPCPSPTAC